MFSLGFLAGNRRFDCGAPDSPRETRVLVASGLGWNMDPYIDRTRNLLLVQEVVIVSAQANAKRSMSADLLYQ